MSFSPFLMMHRVFPTGIPAKNPPYGGCRISRFECPKAQIGTYESQERQDFHNRNAFAAIKRFGMYVSGNATSVVGNGKPVVASVFAKTSC